MPNFADDAPSSGLVKGLLLGDGGSRKTTSLQSLARAGYDLYIYDFDNLLTPLAKFLKEKAPEALGNVHYQTFTDKLKAADTPAIPDGKVLKIMPVTDGTPKAYSSAMKQLTKWTADGQSFDPGTLGPKAVVVIDTLTSAATAAYRYVQALNPLAKEQQTWFYGAQQLVMNLIQLLASEAFATHVLVLAHVDYREISEGLTKGFPKSIGSALHTSIANNFNSVLSISQEGKDYFIRHNSTGVLDLKNPAPYSGLPDRLPFETGLADFFRAVQS